MTSKVQGLAHILVIDGDCQMRERLRQALEQAGHNVLEAIDCGTGIELFHRESIDVVIIDFSIPILYRAEAVQEFKRDSPGVKIIAVAQADIMKRFNFLEVAGRLGVDLAFLKPFSAAKILEAVRDLTGEVGG